MYSEPPGFADEGYQSKVSIYTIVLPRAVFDLVPPPANPPRLRRWGYWSSLGLGNYNHLNFFGSDLATNYGVMLINRMYINW